MGDIARFVMTGTSNEAHRHIGEAGRALVFQPRQDNGKSHETISVAGKCYRFACLGKGRFTKVFRCCDDSCCARVHFKSPDDYVMTGNHDFCSFDHERELRRRTRLELAWRIYTENITDTPAEIIRKMEVSMRLCQEEKRSVRTFVSTQRKKEFGSTNTNGARVEIPDVLKTVKRPQSIEEEDVTFLLHDSANESSNPRIVIFSSAKMRMIASTANEFFADGTYHIVPNGFATLYTIHAVVSGEVFPTFFCLMENEKEESFRRVFLFIRPFLLTLDENTVVHTDCQLSAINALRNVFRCKIRLCLFHINQALWRMVSKVGLACEYNNPTKPKLHAYLRLLMSLPFLPEDKIVPCFAYIFENRAFDDDIGVETELAEQFARIVQYYKRFWIRQITPQLWSLFDVVNRTNNHAEAFHRWIGLGVQVGHPNPFVLIQLLRDAEDATVTRYAGLRVGKPFRKSNKRLADLEGGIRSSLLLYKNACQHDPGDFSLEIQLLSNVSKLYVHYYHEQKCSRKINCVAVVQRSATMKEEILRVLDEQNKVTFDTGESSSDSDFLFVESDILSEIVFDSHNENVVLIDRSSSPTIQTCSRCVKTDIRSRCRRDQEASRVLAGGRTKTPQRKTIYDTLKGRRRKKTLLQKMERFRRGRDGNK